VDFPACHLRLLVSVSPFEKPIQKYSFPPFCCCLFRAPLLAQKLNRRRADALVHETHRHGEASTLQGNMENVRNNQKHRLFRGKILQDFHHCVWGVSVACDGTLTALAMFRKIPTADDTLDECKLGSSASAKKITKTKQPKTNQEKNIHP